MGITDNRTEDIELSTIVARPDDNQSQDLDDSNVFGRAEDGEVFSLPPADGGKDAWLFLASCVVFEAISWGKSFRDHQAARFPENHVLTTLQGSPSASVSSNHTTSKSLQTMSPASLQSVPRRQV